MPMELIFFAWCITFLTNSSVVWYLKAIEEAKNERILISLDKTKMIFNFQQVLQIPNNTQRDISLFFLKTVKENSIAYSCALGRAMYAGLMMKIAALIYQKYTQAVEHGAIQNLQVILASAIWLFISQHPFSLEAETF